MGMINHQPSIDDDYSAEVIRLARERSPEIDAWFVEQRYLNEALEDSLTPMWFRNRMTIMLCEELREMGIIVTKDFDEVCDEPQLVYAVSMLRSKFDSDKLHDLFRSHRDLFELLYAEQDEYVFDKLIDWTRDALALDEGWQLISDTLDDNPGIIDVNSTFVQNLRQILDGVDSLGEPDITESVDAETVNNYVSFLAKRQKFVMDVLESIWIKLADSKTREENRRNIMSGLVYGGYEKELGSRSCIETSAQLFRELDLSDKDAVRKFLSTIRAPYLRKWEHCLEYYEGADEKSLNANYIVLMFATMVVDNMNNINVRTVIPESIRSYEDKLGTESTKTIANLFKETLDKVAELPEVDYVAK